MREDSVLALQMFSLRLQTFLGSTYINDFTIYNRNFRVVAQADTNFRNDISALGKYYVRNRQGNMVPAECNLISYKVNERRRPPLPLSTFTGQRNSMESAKPGYSSGQVN